jgi:hypothetical protein
MPIKWRHVSEACPLVTCPATTDCPEFPTVADRIALAEEAFQEYAQERPGFTEFLEDICLLALKGRMPG